MKNKGYEKILILGEMNELGLDELKFHCLVISETAQHMFDNVIFSGDLFKKALKMFPYFKNKNKGLILKLFKYPYQIWTWFTFLSFSVLHSQRY